MSKIFFTKALVVTVILGGSVGCRATNQAKSTSLANAASEPCPNAGEEPVQFSMNPLTPSPDLSSLGLHGPISVIGPNELNQVRLDGCLSVDGVTRFYLVNIASRTSSEDEWNVEMIHVPSNVESTGLDAALTGESYEGFSYLVKVADLFPRFHMKGVKVGNQSFVIASLVARSDALASSQGGWFAGTLAFGSQVVDTQNPCASIGTEFTHEHKIGTAKIKVVGCRREQIGEGSSTELPLRVEVTDHNTNLGAAARGTRLLEGEAAKAYTGKRFHHGCHYTVVVTLPEATYYQVELDGARKTVTLVKYRGHPTKRSEKPYPLDAPGGSACDTDPAEPVLVDFQPQ